MTRKIAFIKLGTFSYVNEVIIRQLIEHFPSFEFEIFDVRDLFLYKISFLFNLFFIIKEYGLDILLGNKKAKECFYITSYFIRHIKSEMGKVLSDDRYVFSIQTQSMFDASREGLPHFLYTDHTYLANLYYPSFNKAQFYSKPWIELEKTIYKNATLNFTMSSNISRSLIEQYSCPQDKIACIYVGYNASVEQAEKENNNYSNKSILFVGYEWERKGGPELIEAFKMVLEECPDAKLVIVGCSPQVDIDNCEVMGRVDPKEVSQYYRKASVFCLPTRLEPFGIVFLEAMAHQLPVVGTRIGALPDIITNEKNGYLLEVGDVKELAKTLIGLIKDPSKCRDLGSKGLEIVKERYSWDKVGILLKKNIERFVKS